MKKSALADFGGFWRKMADFGGLFFIIR